MKKKNKLIFLLPVPVVLFAVFFSNVFAAGAGHNFKLHQFLPANAVIPSKFLQPWIEKVQAESNGRIKISHFPSMQLGGSPPSLISQATDGAVDFVWTVAGYTPGRFPRSEAVELPFMVTNAEDTSRAFYEYYEPYFEKELPGLKVITVFVHGSGVIHTKPRPVKTVSDMRGLKMRGPSRMITNLLAELGASPVGMPVPRIPAALSKNVIDGTLIPWQVTMALKISDLLNYHTEFTGDKGIYTIAFIFAMNKNSYERLPLDLRRVIDDNSGIEAASRAGRIMGDFDSVGRKNALKKNGKIITIGEADAIPWKNKSKAVISAWYKDMKKLNIDGSKLHKKLSALIEKHTRQRTK